MRLVRRVRSCVLEHRIDCGYQRLEFNDSRKDRAVADFSIDHERRTLVDLKRMEFGRRCANALLDFRRSRALQQFSGVDATRFSSNLSGNIPIADLLRNAA